MRSELIIEVLPGRLRAAVVSDNQKILARGLFPLEDGHLETISQTVKKAQQGLKHKSSPLLIMPEPSKIQEDQDFDPKYSDCMVSAAMARAYYESAMGSFNKPGKYILFEIGPHIRMVLVERDKKLGNFKEVDLGNHVANYEKLSEPEPEVATLRNYCTESFFIKRAKQNSRQLYEQTTSRSTEDGDELFVEFGTNLGALLAFLDDLIEPDGVAFTGSSVDTYDAWGHAMGKTRNQFQGKKSRNRVVILKDNPDAIAIGGYLYCTNL